MDRRGGTTLEILFHVEETKQKQHNKTFLKWYWLLTILKILLISVQNYYNSLYESNLSPIELKQFFDHLSEVRTIGNELYDDPITIAEIKMNKSLEQTASLLNDLFN